ncbi:MAG: hypothetical protein QM758_09905 [Armatimonas sp.]
MSTQNRPAAAELARIANHLTQVIVTGDAIDDLNVFFDGKLILPGQVESLALNIDAEKSQITAQLSWKENDAHKNASLFPGTVDIVAKQRRLLVTSSVDGSLDGLWLSLGLAEDGTSTELTGVQSLRVLLTPGLIDTKLHWSDGKEEEIF